MIFARKIFFGGNCPPSPTPMVQRHHKDQDHIVSYVMFTIHCNDVTDITSLQCSVYCNFVNMNDMILTNVAQGQILEIS